jgi:hypothetical protein
VRALPGVEQAALANALPLNGHVSAFAADVENHPRAANGATPVMFDTVVTPGYLDLIALPCSRAETS